jgi:hypothetical protein
MLFPRENLRSVDDHHANRIKLDVAVNGIVENLSDNDEQGTRPKAQHNTFQT